MTDFILPLDSQLLDLQKGQLKHDIHSHSDIYYLPTYEKIQHYVLHFVKYQGRLYRELRNDLEGMTLSTIVDSFIIVLAMANALRLNLKDCLESGYVFNENETHPDRIRRYVEFVGTMSMALISHRRLEDVHSRACLERDLVLMFLLHRRFAKYFQMDLNTLVHEKWLEIEKKNFLI